MSRNQSFLILVAVTALMLFVGLRPFDYRVPNDARWVENGPGIRFGGQGLAVADGETGLPPEKLSGGVTLELRLKPFSRPDTHLPHILSFADHQGKELFYLGQWKDSLILREIDHNGLLSETITRTGASGVLDPLKKTMVTLIFDGHGAALFRDGILLRQHPEPDLDILLSESPVAFVVLGNAPTGVEGWEGEIYGVSILNEALSPEDVSRRFRAWKNPEVLDLPAKDSIPLPLFNAGEETGLSNKGYASALSISIPSNIKPIRKKYLPLPSMDALKRGSFYVDVLVNLLGFIPIGFLMSLFLSRGAKRSRNSLLLWGILASAALSLSIELNQAFLLSRDSSITDLILNTAGGGLGVPIFLRLSHFFRRPVGNGK